MTTADENRPANPAEPTVVDHSPEQAAPRGPRGWTRLFQVVRWLHIYLSMFGFASILFFSITGVTLNHPAWFGVGGERTEQHRGRIDPAWLGPSADEESGIDRLRIAEFLRRTHDLRGAVTEFRIEEDEITLAFEGPAYAADVVIDRSGGQYELAVTRHGLVALINDLHKGRDSGVPWGVVIDLSALLMSVSSLTGVVLLFSIRRKRVAGTLTAVAGTVALWLAFRWLVP